MTVEDIRHKFNRLTFYSLLFTFLGVSMTFIIFSSVAQPTLTCSSGQFVNVIGTAADTCGPLCTVAGVNGIIANNVCPAITFDTTAKNGNVGTCPCSISASISANVGDMLVVSASSENQANAPTINVTSVSDTQSDVFTLRIHTYIKNTIFCCSSDIWTGIMSQISTTVTVTYQNSAGGPFALSLIIATYKNTNTVGATGFTCGGASPSSRPPCVIQANLGNFTIVPQKTGSIIVGSSALESGNICTINIIPGSNQTQRSQQCTVTTDSLTTDLEDNSPASYLNGFQYFYSSSFPNPSFTQEFTIQAIELRPIFNGVNANTVAPVQCTKANQLCNLIVANRNSGIQTTQLITANTEYCTGITTTSLTINVTSNIQFNAMYGLDDRNVTSGVVRVILYYSTVAPSTVFGVGGCEITTSTLVAETRLVFGTAGTGTSTSIFAIYTTLDKVVNISTSLGSKFYAWIDIIPFSNMSILQFGATPQSSISMVMLSGQ